MLYGLFGTGDLTEESAEAHLGRLRDAMVEKDEDFWLAVYLAPDPPESVLVVLDWADANDVYWVPFTDVPVEDIDADLYSTAAEELTTTRDIGRKFVSLFKNAEDGCLLALHTGADPDDEDERTEVIGKVLDAGFKVLDLSDGLLPLTTGEDEPGLDPEESAPAAPRYERAELEALELKQLRSLCLAEGNKWPALKPAQSNKMPKEEIVNYLLGVVPPSKEEPAEEQPKRRGRPRKPAESAPAPEPEPAPENEDGPVLTIREIFVKHLTALLEELQG